MIIRIYEREEKAEEEGDEREGGRRAIKMREEGEKTMIEEGEAGKKGGREGGREGGGREEGEAGRKGGRGEGEGREEGRKGEGGRGERGHPTISRAQSLP